MAHAAAAQCATRGLRFALSFHPLFIRPRPVNNRVTYDVYPGHSHLESQFGRALRPWVALQAICLECHGARLSATKGGQLKMSTGKSMK